MRIYVVATRGHVSVKLPNCNVTGGRFRSYVLWVISHNHLQTRHYVSKKEKTVFYSALPLRHTGTCFGALLVPRCTDAN